MNARYTNTYLDALAFATVQNLRSIPLILFALAIAGFVAWSNLPDDATGLVRAATFSLMTFLVFVVLMALQLIFNVYWFAANKDKNFCTEHNVEITETTFIAFTAHTRVEIKWAGVFAVRRGFNRLFIFEGPARAHCIPARAFALRPEFAAFANRARECWNSAS
jgi:hypothetical protein